MSWLILIFFKTQPFNRKTWLTKIFLQYIPKLKYYRPSLKPHKYMYVAKYLGIGTLCNNNNNMEFGSLGRPCPLFGRGPLRVRRLSECPAPRRGWENIQVPQLWYHMPWHISEELQLQSGPQDGKCKHSRIALLSSWWWLTKFWSALLDAQQVLLGSCSSW